MAYTVAAGSNHINVRSRMIANITAVTNPILFLPNGRAW